ncbi:hypothetical protein LCGC14_1794070 [marine sediment metagenome]|uniref:Uncharacterized protein n=1 Tax=marine sediment metagenome TaxID=412755 RepID=A0A0F9J6G5_9ZZZZ
MNRTEAVLGAIRAELERHRQELDSSRGLRAISLIVGFDEKSGELRNVIYRLEEKTNLRGTGGY